MKNFGNVFDLMLLRFAKVVAVRIEEMCAYPCCFFFGFFIKTCSQALFWLKCLCVSEVQSSLNSC